MICDTCVCTSNRVSTPCLAEQVLNVSVQILGQAGGSSLFDIAQTNKKQCRMRR